MTDNETAPEPQAPGFSREEIRSMLHDALAKARAQAEQDDDDPWGDNEPGPEVQLPERSPWPLVTLVGGLVGLAVLIWLGRRRK